VGARVVDIETGDLSELAVWEIARAHEEHGSIGEMFFIFIFILFLF